MVSTCPECGYSLTGLRESHRCPECGFAFSKHMSVYEGRRPSWYAPVLSLSLASIWIAVGAVCCAVKHDALGTILNFAAAVFVARLWHRWAARRRPHYLLLTDAGMTYHQKGRDRLRASYKEIAYAEYSGLSDEIVLFARDGQRLGALPHLKPHDYALAAEICREITTRADGWKTGARRPCRPGQKAK